MEYPRHQTEAVARRRAQQLAALAELGFRRASDPLPAEALRLRNRWKVSQVVAAMGTRVAAVAIDRSRDRAEAALGGAWRRMDALIGTLSRHDSASALSVLNDRGRLGGAPPELAEVLVAAAGMHRRSEGAFDPTVLPVVELLERSAAAGAFREPSASSLADAVSRVDGRGLSVAGREIALAGEGQRVTLDGIAKGYIVDAIATELGNHGVGSFLIDAGGDIRAEGDHDGRPWRIAVREPHAEGAAEVLELRAGAVATSGSYEITFDEQRTRHHLIEPRDGRSPLECASVTVRANDTMTADALATTVFLLGRRAGLQLIENTAHAECLIVARDGTRHRSRAWARSSPGRQQA